MIFFAPSGRLLEKDSSFEAPRTAGTFKGECEPTRAKNSKLHRKNGKILLNGFLSDKYSR
jgi:hypothetical protein